MGHPDNRFQFENAAAAVFKVVPGSQLNSKDTYEHMEAAITQLNGCEWGTKFRHVCWTQGPFWMVGALLQTVLVASVIG